MVVEQVLEKSIFNDEIIEKIKQDVIKNLIALKGTPITNIINPEKLYVEEKRPIIYVVNHSNSHDISEMFKIMEKPFFFTFRSSRIK